MLRVDNIETHTHALTKKNEYSTVVLATPMIQYPLTDMANFRTISAIKAI